METKRVATTKKKDSFLKIFRKRDGQLSIFMGITMICMISLLAFSINVGLFVKAKINLQNAVDAGAWAGAATQARMLSQMAYLNWEIRNNMKEWLFKYYVVGQLSNEKIHNPPLTGIMDFRPRPFQMTPGEIGYLDDGYDKFNVPRVCIEFGGTNICGIYGVPGIPRFPTVGLPGISEHHEEFLNDIVGEKAKDCARRSVLNFGTAMIWTFGGGGENGGDLLPGAPQILATRMGAWPKAIELAMRMRNLEMIVNRPPVEEPICASGSECTRIDTIQELNPGTPIDERPIKAFFSAWRNLDGGYNGDLTGFRDMKNSFKLTELAPTAEEVDANSFSGYLINEGFNYKEPAVTALKKSYIDLQLMPINYIIFYTTFVPANSEIAGESAEAACAQSVTGLPVPGFIVGFGKNPNVLTYYAVRGTAKFVGLFYPFDDNTGIELNAYAAAKPFGGRIGPRLFSFRADEVVARGGGASAPRTAAYIMGVDTEGVEWDDGLPIPITDDFYLTDPDEAIGGVPRGVLPKFGVPNMVYDWVGNMGNHIQAGADKLYIISHIDNTTSESDNPAEGDPENPAGLYDKDQFEAMKNIITDFTNISTQTLTSAVIRVRGPNVYDAANYMIPSFGNDGSSNLETFDQVIPAGTPTSGSGQVQNFDFVAYNLYAPLAPTPPFLFDKNVITAKIRDYLKGSELAKDAFLDALKDVATVMREEATRNNDSTEDGRSYAAAANQVYPEDGDLALPRDCEGIAMAEQFNKLFDADDDGEECLMFPIHIMAADAIQENLDNNPSFATFHTTTYAADSLDSGADLKPFYSAYMPGDRYNASNAEAEATHPLNDTPEYFAQRNFYSTKLVNVQKLIEKTGADSYYERNPIYFESTESGFEITQDTAGGENHTFDNNLNQSDLDDTFDIPLRF